jgi:hypothetical protein
MHEYLSGLDNFNRTVPLYVEKPFTEKQVDDLKNIIKESKNTRPLASIQIPGNQKEFVSNDRFDPRIMTHISRMAIEFECPEEIEKNMDNYVYPIYNNKIKLAHYSYLDYDMKYGEGEYFPALPPHIDAANTLVTFNYCLDTNIDWEIYIDNVPYSLKAGDAIIFSAVNQVHWRPKREWQDGEFCEIISFDYSPLDDWRFTGGEDPLDGRFNKDWLAEYTKDLNTRKEYIEAWDLYNSLGLKMGIKEDTHGKIKNGTTTNNN